MRALSLREVLCLILAWYINFGAQRTLARMWLIRICLLIFTVLEHIWGWRKVLVFSKITNVFYGSRNVFHLILTTALPRSDSHLHFIDDAREAQQDWVTVPGYTASKWQSQDLNSAPLSQNLVLLSPSGLPLCPVFHVNRGLWHI